MGVHDSIPIHASSFYLFLNIFANGHKGNNIHTAHVFPHESAEGRRRSMCRESGYRKWPPAPLPNHNEDGWRADFGQTAISAHSRDAQLKSMIRKFNGESVFVSNSSYR